jgi:hypothetical protein
VSYKFKSEITLKCLPTGYTEIAHVKRNEVPIFLDRIIDGSKNSSFVEMVVRTKIYGKYSWTPENVLKRLNELCDDIQALKDRLLLEDET